MGPPMDEQRLQRMMEDPNVQQSMNEALNNPDFINMLIQSNPMLRNMPNARELLTSPFMRQMMSNPAMITQAMRTQRGMQGAGSSFPAPGATDTTPAGAAASTAPGSGDGSTNAQNPQEGVPPIGGSQLANAFAMLESMNAGLPDSGRRAANINQTSQDMQGDLSQVAQSLQGMLNAIRPPNAGTEGAQGASGATGATTDETQRAAAPAADNPFAALFPGAGGSQANPFNMDPETMRQMMQLMSGAGSSAPAAPAAPADNRPPEERYADQLRQLNDMGFFDFDRNIAALRRSGGSVQGAVEYLLSQ